MYKTILNVDNREDKLINNLKYDFELGSTFKSNNDFIIDLEFSTLIVGDYVIYHKNINDNSIVINACIERKSYKDLSASIKDGRIDNIEKMINYRNQTGCELYLLIEGPLNPSYDTMYCGIKFSTLLASIDSIMLRDNIKIINTLNIEHTSKRLKFLTESYAKFYHKYVLTNIKSNNRIFGGFNESVHKVKYTNEQKILIIVLNIWSSIKGITRNSARIIQEHITIFDYVNNNINLDILNNIKLSKNVINIISKFNLDYNQSITFLSNFPLISDKTAKYILFHNKFIDIINMDIDKLKNIKISDNNKLGKKKATNIYNLIRNKQFNELINNNIDNVDKTDEINNTNKTDDIDNVNITDNVNKTYDVNKIDNINITDIKNKSNIIDYDIDF